MAGEAKIIALLEIASRAIALDAAQNKRKTAARELTNAYKAWKLENCVNDRVERDTEQWRGLMAATGDEHRLAEGAKREEYNAKRRLQTAIRNYRQKGGEV